MALPDRFWAKVDRRGDGECWPWLGTKNAAGYGRYSIDGTSNRIGYAHRVSYEEHVGPIPAGREIDHLCRQRACVNPAHLEAVTHRENQLRGDSMVARQARRTHCVNGHEFTPENTWWEGNKRRCRTCRSARSAALRARRRNG